MKRITVGASRRITGRGPNFLWVGVITCACGYSQAFAAEPRITDEAINDAITRAVAWIKSERAGADHWDRPGTEEGNYHWAGDTGLACLALLYADEDPRADWMKTSLDWLAGQEITGVYAAGVRAHALALVPGGTYRDQLEADLQWLLRAAYGPDSPHAGAYDYTPHPDWTQGRWDNSVTQYGVLGVWMAAEAGLDVPTNYWETVGRHFVRVQRSDGGWGYQAGDESTGSMTAAGLASLYVALDFGYGGRLDEAGAILSAIDRGMRWFGIEFTPSNNPNSGTRWLHYYLYGVERVGRASGHKYFRDKDWFREGARYLLETQDKDGHWGSTGELISSLHNTCFALMFLCHGRAPILFNKLQHGPDWNAQLRDLAGLTRYVSHTFERLLNWQIVRLDSPIADLLEAPVLYLRGTSQWPFNDVEVQRIREYCLRGGMVFGVVGHDGAAFRTAFEELARRAFPEYSLRPLPKDHPLFSGAVSFPIDDPPLVLELHNGVRTLMLLSTRDLARAWSRYAVRGPGSADFQFAANVYLYATDKATIRSRLETAAIPLEERDIQRTIRVARVRYDGTWNPEPFGWTRLGRYLNNDADTRVLVTSGVRLDDELLREFDVAHLTGTDAIELSQDEIRGLRRYLNGGGTLVADPAGGSREFVRSLEAELRKVTRDEPQLVPPESFLLTGAGIPGGVDLAGTSYRRGARSAAGGSPYPRLRTFGSRRRFSVVYTRLDLSASLLGTPVYDLEGYDADSALKIMRNVLLYAGLSSADKAKLHRAD